MKEKQFKKVAVLGAGVMGAQIAALLANMNVPVVLFELAAQGKDKNTLSKQAIERLTTLKPLPFVVQGIEDQIEIANYDDDLEKLSECTLIIEAIAENIIWKKELYERIKYFINKETILASNTSGLSINLLAKALPISLKPNFIGIHFFNPPRYMHLVEIIPSNVTDNDIVNSLERFLVSTLGKGVVIAKDTPNFIANRVGIFNLLACEYHANRLNIPFEVIDQITSKPLGRPSSGVFRTMDVIGLDVMKNITQTMADNLKNDPWKKYYRLPDYLTQMVEDGALGQKSGKGIYINKGKQVFSTKENKYADANRKSDVSLSTIFKENNWSKRFTTLKHNPSDQTQFVYRTLIDLFHYCCVHLEDIASNAADVDLALRWGFGWKEGPFEIMQSIGWSSVINSIEMSINNGETMSNQLLPTWVNKIDEVHNQNGSWSPDQETYQPLRNSPVYQRQHLRENVIAQDKKIGITIFENDVARLWERFDNIAILSLKTKMHCISEAVLDSVIEACDQAEKKHAALVIWHPAAPFSVGADLNEFNTYANAGDYKKIDNILMKFQAASMALKHCNIPTVAALQGMSLGGGCELQMHCDKTIAAMESQIGLVESSVGLLPAGGGLKELALNSMHMSCCQNLFPQIETAFKTTLLSKRSGSAQEAKKMNLLSSVDIVVPNAHEILHVALMHAKAMSESNYIPPSRDELINVVGRKGKEKLIMIANDMLQADVITDHDYVIAEFIATVLTGSGVSDTVVSQDSLLKLERNYFIELMQTEKTQQRISHTLKTGKPLRN
jgi:3-hydroxyacyl-CoA dehydrogenase